MHKGLKIGIATVCTGMLAVGGYGAYNIATALTGGSDSKSGPPKPRTVVAEAPSADQAAAGAKAFLEAWAKGDLSGASAQTDKPDAALLALTGFKDRVKPSAISLVAGGPGTASAANQVSLTFKTKVEFAETGNPWTYDGLLGLVKMSDGKAAVHWVPSVIHPKLDAGETISVKPVFASSGTVLDRHGKALNFPSLTPLITSLRERAAGAPGDAGTGVVISDDAGVKPAEQLFTIKDPKAGQSLKLTLDAGLQAQAEKAVQQASQGGSRPASLVAVEPSTGNILAIANAPTTGQNRAFLGATAPGSTMKVVTAAALLEAGVSADAAMSCPEDLTVYGQHFKNDFDGTHEDWSMTKDFAQSCNTAFIRAGMAKLKGSELEDTAKQVFGLGPAWKNGLFLEPAKVPAPANPNQRAAQFIGQGSITMNSLSMASVAATVQNGTFHQPILIPGSEQMSAERKLSSGTLQALRQMMRQTVASGTAAKIDGIPGDAGAKTGTAQVGGQNDNSWFTSFRGDLAVAAEVAGGGHGADAAGPAAALVLQVGNRG